MLTRLKTLASQHESFAFETTLASRSFAPWLATLRVGGYAIHLVFLWLSSPELALERVAERVALGGHDVRAEVVRRRYRTGLHNFFTLYRPLASTWRFYDASGPVPRPIARKLEPGPIRVYDRETWDLINRQNVS